MAKNPVVPSVISQKRSFPKALAFAFTNLFFLMAVVACTQSSEATKKVKTATAAEFKTWSAKDAAGQFTVKVKVPADWSDRKDLNDDAIIQSSDKADMLFLAIISEPKSQFDQGTKLEDYSDIVIDQFLKKTGAKAKSEPVKIMVNGRPALQYEIERKMNKIVTIHLFYVTVEGPKGFHQILAWTFDAYWDEKKPLLESVINSFQEE
jgi:hypothetical protein